MSDELTLGNALDALPRLRDSETLDERRRLAREKARREPDFAVNADFQNEFRYEVVRRNRPGVSIDVDREASMNIDFLPVRDGEELKVRVFSAGEGVVTTVARLREALRDFAAAERAAQGGGQGGRASLPGGVRIRQLTRRRP